MKFTVLFIIGMITMPLWGQTTVRISNGKKEKSFQSDSYYRMVLGEKRNKDKENCCFYLDVEGSIQNISKDSVEMRVNRLTSNRVGADFSMKDVLDAPTAYAMNFAIKDVYSLTHYHSKRSKKRRNNFLGTGGILLLTGLATAMNALVLKDQPGKRTLLYSGGAQLGLGLTLIILSKPKSFLFKARGNQWRFK